jgi:hypothetical protein
MYDSGLIAMYNFDNITALGESGTLVKDMSQYGNNGTPTSGATWTGNGRRGGAYTFDGTSNYLTLGNSSNFSLSNNFTISLWINRRFDKGTYE